MKRYVRSDREVDESPFTDDVWTRCHIAETTDDLDLMEIYAHDPACEVRMALAGNKHAPSHILADIHADLDNWNNLGCRQTALFKLMDNPNTPPEIIAYRLGFE